MGMKCDFCNADGAEEIVELEPAISLVTAETQTLEVDHGSQWAVCAICLPLVEAKDTEALIDRVMRQGGWPDYIRNVLRSTYAVLFDQAERAGTTIDPKGQL